MFEIAGNVFASRFCVNLLFGRQLQSDVRDRGENSKRYFDSVPTHVLIERAIEVLRP